MKTTLLIDGDQFLFTACIAVEKEIRWDDQNHVLYSNASEARNNLDGMLGRIFDRFDTKAHILTFTKGVNFRLGVDPTYKNHRAGARKPLCYAQLREDIAGDYKCLSIDTLEADDVMGILATQPASKNAKHIIVSQDKDMRTIPGTLWDGKDLLTISKAEADYFHMYQTLIGDTADGYKGCPGLGPVKAAKLLDTAEAKWPVVLAAYLKAGLTEADALQQAQLARILRHSDWDPNTRTPIMWEPQR